MFHRLLLLLAVAASSAVGAEQLEFCAYLRVGSQELFVLGDPITGRSSEWLRSGQSFSGYSITRFDAKSESLMVTTDGRTLTLFLKTGMSRGSDVTNAQAAALSSRLEMAKGVLRTMRTRYREAHPAVKAQVNHIAELEREIAEQHSKH